MSHSDNSRVDSFLAKVGIQGHWPGQTASLPPRPPMQGAGYGPPPHRHRKHGIGGGRQRRNILSAITLQRQSRPARHPATMTAHRAAWVCHWQSTDQAKSYSVDVGVQQGILCKSTELSTLFCGKTAIPRQSLGWQSTNRRKTF